MSKFSYVVKFDDSGYSVKDILRLNFSFSARMMTRFKQNGCIRLNGNVVRINVLPAPNDVISISLPDEKSGFAPEDVPISPVFEDDDILIIDKPAGYTVHPTKGHPSHTIANGLANYIIDTNQSFKIRFVNRLDMDTSGLLIISKNAYCQENIVKQMDENKVVKKYLSVVKGVLKEDSGTIDAPIGHDPKIARRSVTPDGYPSVTRFKTLERYKKGFSLLELTLETGRTHQIRVHLSYIGHPVVGDHLYGGENVLLIERQALHAHYISFYHPITGELVESFSEMPADIRELINRIK